MILYWGAKNCPSTHLTSLHNQRLYQMCRTPGSCIQLALVTGSRPMAPGPVRSWLGLAAILGPNVPVKRSQRMTPTPLNKECAFWNLIIRVVIRGAARQINSQIGQKFLKDLHRYQIPKTIWQPGFSLHKGGLRHV